MNLTLGGDGWFGREHSEETKNKISNNKERKEKLRQANKGKPKPKGFGIGRKHSKNTKNKMSESAIERILETDQNHTSKLEKEFASILDNLKIKYIQWFYAKDIKAFYDFYIPIKNTIIEVDGDFWHCNPNTKFALPEYKTQKKNIKRDKQKNQWAKDNGFRLLRFWENDIKNNIRSACLTDRKIKNKARSESKLEDIPGIGPKRRKALLNHFGSMQSVLGASIEELCKVDGIAQAMAEEILKAK